MERTPYGTDPDPEYMKAQELLDEYSGSGAVPGREYHNKGGSPAKASVPAMGLELARARIHVERALRMAVEIDSGHEGPLSRILDLLALQDLIEPSERTEKQKAANVGKKAKRREA